MPLTKRYLRAGLGALALGCLMLSGCAGEVPSAADSAPEVGAFTPAREAPFVRVLGTAQDGGLPHAACDCVRCTAARSRPERRRLIAGLAIVLPESGTVFLVDATPDIREQLDRLRDVRDTPADAVDRAPVDGVFLTHAHIGHYLGLAFFGFEAVHTGDLPVYSTSGMARYLRDNGPWSQLVDFDNVSLSTLDPGESVAIGDGVSVSTVKVPHRDEYADTVGFRIEGPRSTVFYVPDTDSWEAWEPTLTDVLAGVDVALLDGTFYSSEELPGRSVDEIGHPLIASSMDLLQEAVAEGRIEVFFTHLNHSNPALDPESPERTEIVSRGFALLEEGQEIGL